MTTLKPCLNKEDWDDYILEQNGHPLQLWGWGEVKATHGWRADRLFAYDGDKVVAAAQVLTRHLPVPLKAYSYVPRGPVGDMQFDSVFLRRLGEYVKETSGSVTLAVEPDTEHVSLDSPWVKSTNKVLPAETVILDITKDEDELMADMVKKTRQYIRKSSAESIEIRQIKTEVELNACLAIYHQTSDRAQFDLHSDTYYKDVFKFLGENSPIFAVFEQGSICAFLWLAISAETAFELYGGVTERGQELRANYALKWFAIRKMKEWGLRRYDFGGLLGEGQGVTTFKKSWAVAETDLAGTFELPLSTVYPLWNKGLPTAKKVIRKIKSLRK